MKPKSKNKQAEVCYKYKDGRFLKTSYIGDGEYELILTKKKIDKECVFNTNWPLSQILGSCDSVYDDKGEFIADTLDEKDFTVQETEIKIK